MLHRAAFSDGIRNTLSLEIVKHDLRYIKILNQCE